MKGGGGESSEDFQWSIQWPIDRSRRIQRVMEGRHTSSTLTEFLTDGVDGIEMGIADGSENGHEGLSAGGEVDGYDRRGETQGVGSWRG